MGLMDKVMGQFIDVIDWTDASNDTIVWKFPRSDDEIKSGAQLIVRESQAAVFLHEGELGDVFKPGRYELDTKNIPVLTSLKSWKYAFDSPFKCDVFFVSLKQFTNLKWGTKNPIMLRDPEFGPVRLRAFGSYCIQIKDPGTFIRQISGTDHHFETSEISDQLRNMLVSRFVDSLGESKIPMLDLAANYSEMGEEIQKKISLEFEEYGITLSKFLIENISLPKEVEQALDKRSQMGILGDVSRYAQFQTADAIRDMANNPGSGGNVMGMVAGMGMGNMMGGTMANNMQSAQAPSPQAPPPPPKQEQWYVAVNGNQSGPFDTATISQQISSGNLKRETYVWKEGMPNWEQAGTLADLSQFFASKPPPMPGM